MFRCSHCARVYAIKLSENFVLLADTNMFSFSVIRKHEFERKDKGYQGLARFLSALEYQPKSLDDAQRYVALQGEPLDSHTATCLYCNHTDTIEHFSLAFRQPLNFFESETLCGCSGELWMERDVYRNRYVMMCDRCGWIKPNHSYSGKADATVV